MCYFISLCIGVAILAGFGSFILSIGLSLIGILISWIISLFEVNND